VASAQLAKQEEAVKDMKGGRTNKSVKSQKSSAQGKLKSATENDFQEGGGGGRKEQRRQKEGIQRTGGWCQKRLEKKIRKIFNPNRSHFRVRKKRASREAA